MVRDSILFKQIKDLLITGLIMVFLIGLAEGCLRIFWPQPTKTVYLTEPPGLMDPDVGVILRPNAKWMMQKPEFKTVFELSPEGFRDKVDHSAPVPVGTKRILIIGSSHTLGAGVDYDDMWVVRFEKACLDHGLKVDVVKAGMNAFDTPSSVRFLEKFYSRYKPDFVIFELATAALLANPLYTEDKPSFDKSSSTSGIKIVTKEKEDLYFISVIKRILRMDDTFYANYNMKKGWGPILSTDSDFRKRQIQSTEQWFLRAKVFAAKQGVKIFVMAIPENTQMLINARRMNIPGIDPQVNDRDLEKFCKEQGIGWISPLNYFSQQYLSQKKELYYRLDGHMNSRGQKALSECVFNNLWAILNTL
ncbi:MAG: hypothetical protein HQL26_07555 [Candidatus Omnitrophica bacterium]|nr:hypothetical protein [Candidatus Omnitrophota bacterium]